MDNNTEQQILAKLEKISDKISAMESSITGTLAEHSTMIAQAQKEIEQMFKFWNNDFADAQKAIADNRHKIVNMDSVMATLGRELNHTMDELRENTKQDYAQSEVREANLKNHNKNQNLAMAIIGLLLTALGS